MNTEEARKTVDAGAEGRRQASTQKYLSSWALSETDAKERPLRPSLASFRRCDVGQQGSDRRDRSSKAHNKRLSDPVRRDLQDRPAQNGHVMRSKECQNGGENSELQRNEGEDKDVSGDECPADDQSGAARRPAWRKAQGRGPDLRALEGWQRETNGPANNEALDKTGRIRMKRHGNGARPSSKQRRVVVLLRGLHGVVDQGPAASNVRGRPRSERADVLRDARTCVPVRGLPSGSDVSSSTFPGHAASRSGSARCGPALFAISVVSAGVFVCTSFQVFSAVRSHGAADEGLVQNGTNDDSAAEAHRAATGSAAMPAEDEALQTAPNSTDVE